MSKVVFNGDFMEQVPESEPRSELDKRFEAIAHQASFGFSQHERMTCESYVLEALYLAYEAGKKTR